MSQQNVVMKKAFLLKYWKLCKTDVNVVNIDQTSHYFAVYSKQKCLLLLIYSIILYFESLFILYFKEPNHSFKRKINVFWDFKSSKVCEFGWILIFWKKIHWNIVLRKKLINLFELCFWLIRTNKLKIWFHVCYS